MIQLKLKRASHVTFVARVALLLGASVVSTGCSMLPFGKSRSAKMARAMRPEIHEVQPNAQSECLAEDARPTAPATAAAEVPACATCACAATASAQTRGGGWAKPASTAAAAAPVAGTARRVEAAGPAERQLQRLMDGNKRFVEGEADHDVWARALTHGRITSIARRPAPLAVIITRGDAGDGDVAPEAVFDAMPGELLVIPAAGDVADEVVVQTVRDAVQQYEIPLVVVLGRRPTALPTVDSAARQASLKIGRESAAPTAQSAPQTAVDRLATSDASLGARVAARRLKIVSANCEEANGQVSLDLGSDAEPAMKAPAVEQVVQLSQD